MYTIASSVGAGKVFFPGPRFGGALFSVQICTDTIQLVSRRFTMKSFFKSVFVSIFAILALGFVTSANANCISGCPDSPSTTTQTFQVGGSANFGGNGMAVFSGKEGYTLVEKTGAAGVDIKMNTEGNLCGLACQNGSFKFNGYANEHVTASAGAKGNQSGVASQVKNSGAAYGAVNFSLKK